MNQKEQAAREQMREWGKRGGRPRSIPHNPEWKNCQCADCRRGKRERKEAARIGDELPGGEVRAVVKDEEAAEFEFIDDVGSADVDVEKLKVLHAAKKAAGEAYEKFLEENGVEITEEAGQ